MKEARTKCAVRCILFVGLSLVVTNTASAHVVLDLPNGGEVLQAGTTYTVEWHVLIEHDLQNWDLWYSFDGGVFTPIATDLPAGDPTAGSIHTFEWTVPNTPTAQGVIRVQQDNSAQDYTDESNAVFTIEAGVPVGVPTVSAWGVAAMTLLVMTAGTLLYARRRAAA